MIRIILIIGIFYQEPFILIHVVQFVPHCTVQSDLVTNAVELCKSLVYKERKDGRGKREEKTEEERRKRICVTEMSE